MGAIKLKHTSGNGTILNSPAANPSSDITLKLPSTTGSAGQVLQVASANHSSTNAELEFATVGGGVPTGGIIIWSGAANAIPTGFVLCDGNNSTPDLRDRFVVGAGNTYNVAATGGATTDSISVSISGTTGASSANSNVRIVSPNSPYAESGHTHSFSGSGSATVDTLPPYYALCYIMKT